MARYLLIGAVGGPNFGDELILLTWINTIRQNDPNAQIFCDGYNLGNLKLTVEGLAEVVEDEESLWRLCSSLERNPDLDIWSSISKLSIDNGDVLFRNLYALSEKKIDQIHIIGGGYLNNLWQANYLILVMSRLLAWLTGARLIATGLGLTPMDSADLPGLRAVLKTFDIIDVRDEGSFSLISEIENSNIFYTGDDALLALSDGDFYRSLQKVGEKSLILCLQNDLFDGTGIAEKIISSDVLMMLNEFGIKKIIFAKAMSEDVSEYTADFKSKLEISNFQVTTIEPQELVKNGFPLSNGGIIITSRYHPHFLGALSGSKGIAITSLPYYDTKHEAVLVMGSNWPVLNANDFDEVFFKVLQKQLDECFLVCTTEVRDGFVKKKNELVERVFEIKNSETQFPIEVLEIFKRYSNFKIDKLSEINILNNEIVELNNEIISLNKQINQHVNLNISIVNSFSWKITSPFRWLYCSIFKK